MIFDEPPEAAILNDPDLVFLLNAGNASSGGDGITGGNGTWYDMSGNEIYLEYKEPVVGMVRLDHQEILGITGVMQYQLGVTILDLLFR